MILKTANAEVQAEVPVTDVDRAKVFYKAVSFANFAAMERVPNPVAIFRTAEAAQRFAGHLHPCKPAVWTLGSQSIWLRRTFRRLWAATAFCDLREVFRVLSVDRIAALVETETRFRSEKDKTLRDFNVDMAPRECLPQNAAVPGLFHGCPERNLDHTRNS
ncbi:MAG: hypothetical protein JJ897_07410 [Marinibacterium sp.]|nr:hypothetical protein [Marinibacterium sp.]